MVDPEGGLEALLGALAELLRNILEVVRLFQLLAHT